MLEVAYTAGGEILLDLNKAYRIKVNETSQKVDEGIPSDKLSHDIIYKSLMEPGLTIISEEYNNTLFDLSRGYIVDPLDGTGNASGKRKHLRNFYSISIAYFEDGEIKAAVVHFPSYGITITDNYRVSRKFPSSIEGLIVAGDSYEKLMTQKERERIKNRIEVYHFLER